MSQLGVVRPMTDFDHDPATSAATDTTPTDEQLMVELAGGRPDALGALYAIWRGAGSFDPEQGSFQPTGNGARGD